MNLKTETVLSDEQAAAQPPLPPEQIAPHFPQLEILECLGRGGMGVVYKARQKSLNRLVALKLLAPELASDPQFAARFEKEARALAALNHPNIVAIYEFGRADLPDKAAPLGRADLPVSREDGAEQPSLSHSMGEGGRRPGEGCQYYLLMEFVDGVNLRQLLQGGRVSAREALAIVPQICDALQYAHDQGIVHRDIKPENLLMDRRGRVKVADFGLAKIVGSNGRADLPVSREDGAAECDRPSRSDAASTESLAKSGAPPASGSAAPGTGAARDLTDAGKVMGTPQYMSPEQVQTPGEVDHRADIYALGVVFYQMLTGELPGKKIEPPSKKVSIDVRLDEIVLRALEKKPELRYQQASILKTQVETIASTPDAGSSGRESAQTEKSESGNRKAETEPRFSRTAIVGLSLVSIPMLALGYAALVATISPGAKPWELSVLRFWDAVLKLLGIAALMVTSILGWLAVAQIRRSAGKIHGLRLAVFDGLLFPLLALNIAIGGVVWLLLMTLVAGLFHQTGSPGTLGILLLSLPILILLNRYIIRRVWRAVNQPVATSSPEPQQKPRTGREIFEQLFAQVWGKSEPGHFWRWLAVAVLAAITIPIVLKMTWLALVPATTQPPQTTTIASGPARTLNGPPFIADYPGGTIELVALSKYPETNEPCWLPDGSPSPEPFPKESGSFWMSGHNLRLLAVRVRSRDQEVSPAILRFPTNSACNGMGYGCDYNHPGFAQTIERFGIESNAPMADFQIGVADGDWETVSTLKPGTNAILDNGAIQKSASESYGDGWQSGVDCIVARDGSMSVSFRYSERDDYQTRMMAVQSDGTKRKFPSGPLNGSGGLMNGMASFTATEAAKTVAFESQKRKYQWVEFRNVSLQPGHRTTMAVKDFGGETKLAAPEERRQSALSRNGHSALVVRTDAEVKYALYYQGIFNSTLRGSHDLHYRQWEDDGVLELPSNGRTFAYHCQALAPDRLSVNGREFNLPKGRLFVLQDDGLVKQLDVFPSSAEAEDVDALAKQVQAATVGNQQFGPVVERAVNDISERQGNEALQLGSGELLTMPASARELNARQTWMENNHADLLLDFKANHRLMLADGMKLADFPTGQWEAATPAEITQALQTEASGFSHAVETGEGDYWLTKEPVFPTTLAFDNGRGVMGLLQITGFTDNPRGVKIRYKLVQNGQSPHPAAAAQPAASTNILPAKTIVFINCPVSQVLEVYAALTGAVLDADQGVRQLPRTISYTNVTDLSREEAAAELEQALRNQAGITATHLGAKLIKLTQAGNGVTTPAIPASELEVGTVAEGTNCFVDFDSGRTVTPPEDVREAFRLPDWESSAKIQNWLKWEGIDMIRIGKQTGDLRWFGPVRTVGYQSPGFVMDKPETPELLSRFKELRKGIVEFEKNPSKYQTGYWAPFSFPVPDSRQPDTGYYILMVTDKGKAGVMQVLQTNFSSPTVKIRYKLVQNGGPVMQSKTNHDSSGLDDLMKLLNEKRLAATNPPSFVFSAQAFLTHDGRRVMAKIQTTSATNFDGQMEGSNFVVNFVWHKLSIEPQRLVLDGTEIAKLSSNTTNYEVLITNVDFNVALTVTGNGQPVVSTNLSTLVVPPKLQFLAWQDQWQTNQPGAARHPDGSPVTNATELNWLKEVRPSGGLKQKPEQRFLILWVSHPTFTLEDFTELLDEHGNRFDHTFYGFSAANGRVDGETYANLPFRCWKSWSISPEVTSNLPPRITLRLRYAIGPLEQTGELVAPYFNERVRPLILNYCQLNVVGQDVRGRALVSISLNEATTSSRVFEVVAVCKDGRELHAALRGYSKDKEDFTFETPLSDVAKFIIGTRPIRTVEWTNVALPKN